MQSIYWFRKIGQILDRWHWHVETSTARADEPLVLTLLDKVVNWKFKMQTGPYLAHAILVSSRKKKKHIFWRLSVMFYITFLFLMTFTSLNNRGNNIKWYLCYILSYIYAQFMKWPLQPLCITLPDLKVAAALAFSLLLLCLTGPLVLGCTLPNFPSSCT